MHFLGELLDHFRILNITTLSGNRHQQMMANQPVISCVSREFRPCSSANFSTSRAPSTEWSPPRPWRYHGTGRRSGSAPGAPDVATDQRTADGGSRLFFSEAFQLQHDADCVLIYRIGVKQVELHLPDNMRPLGHIGPQYAVTVHRQQTAADGARMTKHAQEQRARLRDVTQRLLQMASCMAQMTQGGGVDPGDRAVAHHGVEHSQDRFRFANEQRFVAQIDKRAAQLKFVINRTRFSSAVSARIASSNSCNSIWFSSETRRVTRKKSFIICSTGSLPSPRPIQALRHAELSVKQQAVIVAGDFRAGQNGCATADADTH